MTGNASEFIGDIPKNYDEGLGPNIFEDFASDIAIRAAAHAPSEILELAAGTGIVSRKLKNALPNARIVVTDLNPPMLEVARSKFARDETVEFVMADAMALDYEDGSISMIVCQFGVMFFPDKIASFREALRVLRPGGIYLFNVWGTMAENPFSQIAQDVSSQYFPKDPPKFYRVPFSYADPAVVLCDLRTAGFSDISHTPVEFHKVVDDFSTFALGIVFGNPLIDEIKMRGGVDPGEVSGTVAQRFRDAWGNESTAMPLKASVFMARKAVA